jgi:uncharacterized membrane protein SpoIIM required for sporulation
MSGTSATLTLKSSEFRRAREAGWRELEGLLERAQRNGVAALRPEELERLPLLYRATLSSLSVARAIALDRHLLLYLEDLCLRAYLVVYGPRGRLRDGFLDFIRHGFPASVQAARWHVLVALLALLAGAAAGFFLTISDEAWFSVIVPAWLSGGRGPLSTHDELLRDEIAAPWPGFLESFVEFANFLFRHNAAIGILSFGLGVLGGVPTLLLTAYQGLTFGTLLALHYDRDLTWAFLGWVSMHGGTEFGAVLLCAAGGLLVAERMLFPGRHSRLDSLALRGGTAARIAVGATLMFLIAAILEGGLRQLIQPTPWRLGIGLVIGAAWIFYFSRPVREPAP